MKDYGVHIFDVEVWVTPLTILYCIEALNHPDYKPKYRMEGSEPRSWDIKELFDEDGYRNVLKYAKDSGVLVRVKNTVSKPRFHEAEWQRTNNIEKVS